MPASPSENIDLLAVSQRVHELGEWFHNLDLHGVPTAPNHFLGNFPTIKWQKICRDIPEDLQGASVLDIGCNGGFYSVEMKRRGAGRVLAVDIDDRYLNQARFAAQTLGLQIEFEKLSVYEIDSIAEKFDYVLFMGVFYHLRYPLLALDRVVKKVGGKLIFQTMIRGSKKAAQWEKDYSFWTTEIFDSPEFPAMYFIEGSYSGDATNWWVPNRNAVEAMLRSSGLQIVGHPEEETWICEPAHAQRQGRYIVDLEIAGELRPEEGNKRE